LTFPRNALLEPLFPVTKGIRLLGMTLSSLDEKQLESEPQLRLSF
jgi:DNA polymerase-4